MEQEERFNPLGAKGRDCPVCFRSGSLLVARGGPAASLECGDSTERVFERVGGCLARFRVDGGDLVRERPDAAPRRLTHAELERVRGGSA